jgi:hypothetical protein
MYFVYSYNLDLTHLFIRRQTYFYVHTLVIRSPKSYISHQKFDLIPSYIILIFIDKSYGEKLSLSEILFSPFSLASQSHTSNTPLLLRRIQISVQKM